MVVTHRPSIETEHRVVSGAAVGSETLRLVRREGVAAVGPFLRSLR